jgi:hypothetical protein
MHWIYLGCIVASAVILEYFIEKAIIAWRGVMRADREMREWQEKNKGRG